MKTSLRKTLLTFLLVLMLFTGASAQAEARYPAAPSAALADDANALNQAMTGDVNAYAALVEEKTGVKLRVALVLFLDGETVQNYTDALYTRWNLDPDALLVVGAAAEDVFAFATGENVKAKLSDASLNSLLYASGFADAFRSQNYDAAFGSFFLSLNGLMAKQYGVEMPLGSLFSAYQPAAVATPTPSASPIQQATDAMEAAANATYSLWTSTMDSIGNHVKDYETTRDSRDENGGGMSVGGWVVLGIIQMIIFGQRGARRGYRGGCGCSPLGWILGGLGLGALFGRREDPRYRRWGR